MSEIVTCWRCSRVLQPGQIRIGPHGFEHCERCMIEIGGPVSEPKTPKRTKKNYAECKRLKDMNWAERCARRQALRATYSAAQLERRARERAAKDVSEASES